MRTYDPRWWKLFHLINCHFYLTRHWGMQIRHSFSIWSGCLISWLLIQYLFWLTLGMPCESPVLFWPPFPYRSCSSTTRAIQQSMLFLFQSQCYWVIIRLKLFQKLTTFGESQQPDIVFSWLNVENLLRIPAVRRGHDESARFTSHKPFIVARKKLFERFFLCLRDRFEFKFPLGHVHVWAAFSWLKTTCETLPFISCRRLSLPFPCYLVLLRQRCLLCNW